MHIILTQQEINDYIKRYLSIPSDVEVTVSLAPEDTVKTSANTDGWIVNTQIQDSYPPELNACDSILVEFTYGETHEGIATSWEVSWNTERNTHIVKYRKI